MGDKVFYIVHSNNLPKSKAGESPVDLFVYLPVNNKYIRFIRKGSFVNDHLKAKLDKRKVLKLFSEIEIPGYTDENPVTEADVAAGRVAGVEGRAKQEIKIIKGKKAQPQEVRIFKADKPVKSDAVKVFYNTTDKIDSYASYKIVGAESAGEKIKDVIRGLSDDNANPEEISNVLDQVADEIMEVFSPDLKNLKVKLIKSLNDPTIVKDSSALIVMAILFSLANGFDSKKPLRDLIFASLVMDRPLDSLNPTHRALFYTNKEQLPEDVLKQVMNHPVDAHKLAQDKLHSVTETSLQLILCHHELFNGKGYPRAIRTESAVALVKVMALAVDVYESIVKARYNNEAVSVYKMLDGLLNEDTEPHLRRHNRKLVQNCIDFTANELQ